MRRVVLLGAGHAHVEVAARAAELVRRGAEVVLVAPDDFWYSGLATGVLGGHYPPALDVVDVEALVARAGGRMVRDVAVAIDAPGRRVTLGSGATLDYDLLSLDVGSEVAVAALPGAAGRGLAVKPLSNLVRLRADLEGRFARGERPRVVVVGGGPSGCEVAAAVGRLAVRQGARAQVTLLADAERVLPQVARTAAQGTVRALERRGIRCVARARVTSVEAARVRTADGTGFDFDVLVLATGLAPPPLLRGSGLPADGAGALIVDATLRARTDPRVLGAGDCIAFEGRSLPRIGVYAVRQAPVLLCNLAATLDGRALRRYRPQRRALLILNLGDGTGLATWGRFAWRGRAAFRLKDAIDRRWLARLRA